MVGLARSLLCFWLYSSQHSNVMVLYNYLQSYKEYITRLLNICKNKSLLWDNVSFNNQPTYLGQIGHTSSEVHAQKSSYGLCNQLHLNKAACTEHTIVCVSRAGHDTTASAVSWILYSLCEHPEYQHKVQQEIDTVLQGRDSDDIQWWVGTLWYLALELSDPERLKYQTAAC